MRMKAIEQTDYLVPKIEVNEVYVEQGFGVSQLEHPNEELGNW